MYEKRNFKKYLTGYTLEERIKDNQKPTWEDAILAKMGKRDMADED